MPIHDVGEESPHIASNETSGDVVMDGDDHGLIHKDGLGSPVEIGAHIIVSRLACILKNDAVVADV
jgi:hypothetical protein